MQEEENKEDLTLADLGQYIGTFNYYDVFGTKITDGVKYIMDNGYSWFITDTIIVARMKKELKKQPFLTIKLKLIPQTQGEMIITDGNDNVLYRQLYKYTDGKKEFELFLVDNVLMVTSEY